MKESNPSLLIVDMLFLADLFDKQQFILPNLALNY